MSDIRQTPFCCSLSFRGGSFAWFHDSNLGVLIANELLAVGLIASVNLYHSAPYNGFDVSSLKDMSQWTRINVRETEIFICYHKSIKVVEQRQIGRIIQEVLFKYKPHEKSYY